MQKEMKIEEKILTPILEHYFNVASTNNLEKGIKTKERITSNYKTIIF